MADENPPANEIAAVAETNQHVQLARMRKDNQRTITTSEGWTSTAITTALQAIDISKYAIEARKIAGGTYKGRGDKNVSGVKYIITLKQVAKRMVMSATFPRGTPAEEAIDNLIKEFGQTEDMPSFIEPLNRLFYRLQVACCDGAALNTILRYEHLPDEQHTFVEDGRRAFFQTWQNANPVSMNASQAAKKDIENFFFTFDKDTIHDQVDTFNTLISTYEGARLGFLDSNERWAFVTNAISKTPWDNFRTVLGFQSNYLNQDSIWLIDRIIEHVIANPNQSSNASKLGAATGSSGSDNEIIALQAQVAALTAKLGAITTANDTNPRGHKPYVRGRDRRVINPNKSSKPDKEKKLPPLPCRHCGEWHWDNECPNMPASAPKPPIKARAAALTAEPNNTGGFLMAARGRPNAANGKHVPDRNDREIISSLSDTLGDDYFKYEYDHDADTDEEYFLKDDSVRSPDLTARDDHAKTANKKRVRSPDLTARDDHAKKTTDDDVRSPGTTRDDHVEKEIKDEIDHEAVPGRLGCAFTTTVDDNTKPTAGVRIFAAVLYFLLSIMFFITQITGGNIFMENPLRVQVVRSPGSNSRDDHGYAAGSYENIYGPFADDNGSFPTPHFMVDSGASHNICHDRAAFDELDLSVRKNFSVVHGDSVTATGGGWVTITGPTKEDEFRCVTFYAYYIPEQQMSLISVSDFQEKITGCADPSFTNLSWPIQPDATFNLTKVSGMFRLDACANTRVDAARQY